MNKKIIWLILSCLMVLSLVIASCGPAVTEEEEGVTEEEEEEEAVTEEEEELAEEAEVVVAEGAEMVVNTAGKLVERPKYGGWYYMRRSSDLRGFDDVRAMSPQYMTYTLNLTHDELYTGDWSRGPQGTDDASWRLIYAPYYPHLEVPCLATGYEMPDDETIIWTIRQGVNFQDRPPVNGREFNAHDVVFNLRRAYWTKGAYLYNTYRQDRGESPISIEAIDDWTVEMKVPPARQIPILFASNDYVNMQAPEVIEEYGEVANAETCIGTGPFFFTDYVPVSSLTFERNPDYWRTNPLHPEDQLPYVDGIQILVVPDASTAQAAFRVGKLETSGVSKEDWEALLLTTPELLWRRTTPTGCAAIYMRTDKPELPYDDIRVRKALYYGIDHEALIEDYYEGEAEMITAPVAHISEFKGMWTPLEEYSEEVQKLYGFYPEEGRQLLAEAGYPDGFECTVLASGEGMLPVIKDWWEKNLNVILNIDVRQSQVVSSIAMGSQHEDMYYGGESGEVVLKCNQWRTDSYLNYSMIDDEEFNEWFKEWELEMLDWDRLTTMMKYMEPRMRAQANQIYLPAGYGYYMWWPWLKGWFGETNVGYYNAYSQMIYLWVDAELREEMVGLRR